MVEIFNMLRKEKKNRKTRWVPTNVYVVPRLKEPNEIICSPGDTLIASIDTEYIELSHFNSILEALEKQFPNNNILCMPNSIEIQKVSEK